MIKLLSDGIDLNTYDAREPELSDLRLIPDNIRLSGSLKSCLQESELEAGVGPDFMKAFDTSLFALDLDLWPEVIRFVLSLSEIPAT